MKNLNFVVVIIYGVCAVIWSVRFVLDIIRLDNNSDMPSLIMNGFIALIWIFAFFVQIFRYRSEKKDS